MAKKTIKIKSYLDVQEELIANAAVTPGMLVEEMSTGKARAHATQDGNALPMFAVEDEMQGKIITENYAADDPIQCWIPQRGDQVYAILVSGQNVAIGEFLTSNGDGKLKAEPSLSSTGDVKPLQVVGVATEAVNASVADARIIIRVI